MKQEKQPSAPKGVNKNYFTQQTEDAIVRFQQETDVEKKQQIFVVEIKEALDKLVENIIFVYKFHTLGNIDVLKNDCASFLFENLSKFDQTKGHKAFSYYSVIARNWFSQKVKLYKKKNSSDLHLDKEILSYLEKNNESLIVKHSEDEILKEEFLMLLKEDVQEWRKKFLKPQEQKVLESIITLLENPEFISIYNKKAIYLYIREMTGLNTKQIVTNLTKFKRRYNGFKKKYFDGEV